MKPQLLHKESFKLAKNKRSILIEKIMYRTKDGVEVDGFVARPKQIHGNLPCVIFNRGGYKDFGKITPYLLQTWISKIAGWGFIVIASQYRNKDEYGGADLQDVLDLREILKRIPQADTNRIAMIGFSRGAVMTYLALSHVRWIRAAVAISGPTDLARGLKIRPEMKQVMQSAFGGGKKELISRSAVNFAKHFSKKTPLLILHGTKDNRVDPRDALDLSYKLLKTGHPHRLILFEKAGHDLSEVEEKAWLEIQEWLTLYS